MEEYVKATYKGIENNQVKIETDIYLESDAKAKLAMCVLALTEKLIKTDDDFLLFITQVTEIYKEKRN